MEVLFTRPEAVPAEMMNSEVEITFAKGKPADVAVATPPASKPEEKEEEDEKEVAPSKPVPPPVPGSRRRY